MARIDFAVIQDTKHFKTIMLFEISKHLANTRKFYKN